MKIILCCELQLKSGSRDLLVSRIRQNDLEHCVQCEPGNLDYRFLLPIGHDDSLTIMEVWASEHDLAQHKAGANVKLWHQIADAYIVGRKHQQYSV